MPGIGVRGSTTVPPAATTRASTASRSGTGTVTRVTERGIFDGPDPAIDSGFSFGSGLDAVVLIRHVELLEAPAKYAFEEGLSLTHILYCEIEVGWLHGFDVFGKLGRAARVPCEG
jgi:hypothetical protein